MVMKFLISVESITFGSDDMNDIQRQKELEIFRSKINDAICDPVKFKLLLVAESVNNDYVLTSALIAQ